MTISDIISILENRLINLQETRRQAVASGLLDQVVSMDLDIATTTASLETLRLGA